MIISVPMYFKVIGVFEINSFLQILLDKETVTASKQLRTLLGESLWTYKELRIEGFYSLNSKIRYNWYFIYQYLRLVCYLLSINSI